MTADYEVEFHPVGDASKAGDAISIRYTYGQGHGIIVVDGGTDDSGKALVDHIKQYYGEGAVITHAVSTHPDSDHACGLRAILKNFKVQNLWVHGLWHHAEELRPFFKDKRWTALGLATSIRESYPVIEELMTLAAEQGTTIYEPFQGATIGPFTVLSPSRYAYLRLVPQFRKTPEVDLDAIRNDQMFLEGARKISVLDMLLEKAAKAIEWIDEQWDIELLREGATTAAENESSTILFGQFGDRSVLLTADAGVNALRWAQDFADAKGLDWSSLVLIQVPHHGSRSNVTPSTLNRLLGSKVADASVFRGTAIASVPRDDEKHPRKMVVNAFKRRGWTVYKTQGVYFRKFSSGYPRAGEVSATPFDWFAKVEQYD